MGQCADGVILGKAQARMAVRPAISYTGPSQDCNLRIYRGVLQPSSQAFQLWLYCAAYFHKKCRLSKTDFIQSRNIAYTYVPVSYPAFNVSTKAGQGQLHRYRFLNSYFVLPIILLAVLMISAGVICLTLYRRKENA